MAKVKCKKHRYFFFVFLVVIIAMISSPRQGKAYSQFSSQTEKEYVLQEIKRYIACENIDKRSALSMSQPFEIVNADIPQTKQVFLFLEGQCIGVLTFAYNGRYSSSFIHTKLSQITACAETGEPIALIADAGELLLSTKNGVRKLLGEKDDSSSDSLSNRIIENAAKRKIVLTGFSDGDDAKEALRGGNYLSVPIVSNTTSPDTGKGLCWAASIAAIINYRCSDEGANYSALGLYNLLKTAYPGSGYPYGSAQWEQRGFNIASLTYTHVNAGTTFSNVQNIIDQYRPIYCGLQRTGAAHAVVIVGYYIGYGYYAYRLMDPNLTYYINVTVDNTSSNFTYSAPYGITFTNWCRRYH